MNYKNSFKNSNRNPNVINFNKQKFFGYKHFNTLALPLKQIILFDVGIHLSYTFQLENNTVL